jgi:formylmethanofuran dehydrogenase subunit E
MIKMNEKEILISALKFHGHKCWASVVGVGAGLTALRTLDVPRSGGTQLYAIIETGEEHGGMTLILGALLGFSDSKLATK